MLFFVDVTVVYGRWRKVASIAARGSRNHSVSLAFGTEDTTTLTSFYFYLFAPNYASATLLLDMFFKGHFYHYFYLTNADLEIKCFKVTRGDYVVDLGELGFPHLSYGSEWECRHTEMERSENWGEFLYIKEYLLSIWPYSPNYAVPTLGIYREEYYHLVEMSKPWNWWLINRVRYTGRSEFHLNEYIVLMYSIFIHRVFMKQTLYYYHHNNHSNQPISPTPTSVVF